MTTGQVSESLALLLHPQKGRRMHMALANIAGNPIHESVLRTIHDNIHKYYESYLPRGKKVVD
jgi:DNA-binding FadR family transcriptional regulator